MFSIQKSQVCHISSYQLERLLRTTDSAQNAVSQDIGSTTVKQQRGADSVHQKHMQHKHAGGMQTLFEIIQLHQVEERPQYNQTPLELSHNKG